MKLKRRLICGGLLVIASLTLTGCGGIQGSHSISPASFLLPGFIHNGPAKQNIETRSETESIAQNNSKEAVPGRI